MNHPIAHAQWFVDARRAFPVEWGSLGSAATLSALTATALLGAAIIALSRSLPPARPLPAAALAGVADRVPAIIGATLGLGLIGLTLLGFLWTPAIRADDVGGLLIVAQTLVGAWLVLGLARVGAAIAVLALGAVVAVAVDPLAVLAAAYIPGAAIALLALAKPGDADAALALRIGMGVGLVAAAVIEKLAAPTMMVLVVRSHPQLNVFADVGLGAGPEAFTLVAGCVEVLLGGLLIAGVASEIVALCALGPMLATVPMFGATELVGHLPIYGVLVAVAALAVPRKAAVSMAAS